MRDPDSIKLEALENAFNEMLAELEDQGFENAGFLWALVPQTEAVIVSEMDPADFDDFEGKPFWELKMEQEMAQRMMAIETTMRQVSRMTAQEITDLTEEAAWRAESEAERQAEMRAGC